MLLIKKRTSMKQILSFVILLLFPCLMVQANDAVYYASGSFLFPTRETDISVSKEILTITLQKGDYASVDVYYEFVNPGEAKTVLMAFDAGQPIMCLPPSTARECIPSSRISQ